ncbi:MAG: hypothetical protein WCG42_02480 [Parachlamydiaceae bacterium]
MKSEGGINMRQSIENLVKNRIIDHGGVESMFFREIPAWESILKTIEQFEDEFNGL